MVRKICLLIAGSLFIMSNFAGCTLIGVIGGAITDNNRATCAAPAWKNRDKIKPGTTVKVQLRDQQVIAGTFREWAALDSAEYSRRYAAFCTEGKNSGLFPALLDTVRFYRKLGLLILPPDRRYRFSGFDLNSLRLQTMTNNQIRFSSLDTLVTIIDQQGKNMDVQTIKVYLDNGRVPLRSELVMQANEGIQRIGGEKIIKIKLPVKPYNMLIYGIIGLGLDVLVIRLMAQDMSHSLGSGMTNWNW
jgi:hypothetical protein